MCNGILAPRVLVCVCVCVHARTRVHVCGLRCILRSIMEVWLQRHAECARGQRGRDVMRSGGGSWAFPSATNFCLAVE